ncbi:hypothetical protein ACONUD_13670 [Microbulbifer harenosus]|uniref:DUF3649 domain-containing protein n=1 Tax=Microbulbifer harenosus TaxID=2576840 RepID=A0ABY2URX5_9GAMM|nr:MULTISPECIES: hypothetical protein [Microbulbifer]QIL91076.1 hypothetical protein GNX18_15800 [Microbulbifer sp. SH-1]TLM79295.1 hypothetical protein FDY93_04140 [Microbulbifer harenosus]
MGLHGWRLISLIGAALLGGYILATAAGIFLAGVLPFSIAENTLIGHLSGFAFYTGAILWVFHTRRPGVAWASLILASTLLASIGLALRQPAVG